jgi:hypothetical protein
MHKLLNAGASGNSESEQRSVRQKRAVEELVDFPTVSPLRNQYSFIDQAKLSNRISTDAFGGFPCNEKTYEYLNNDTVREKLHIPPGLKKWEDCK